MRIYKEIITLFLTLCGFNTSSEGMPSEDVMLFEIEPLSEGDEDIIFDYGEYDEIVSVSYNYYAFTAKVYADKPNIIFISYDGKMNLQIALNDERRVVEKPNIDLRKAAKKFLKLSRMTEELTPSEEMCQIEIISGINKTINDFIMTQ